MLLTSTQVSWAVSAAIITFFTIALFLSGYVLQRQTVDSLREAIPDIPNRQILAQAQAAGAKSPENAIPVPIVENPRFRGSSRSRQEQRADGGTQKGGVDVSGRGKDGAEADVLEVADDDLGPRRGKVRAGSESDKVAENDGSRTNRQQEASGGQVASGPRGREGSVGAAMMNPKMPVQQPVDVPGRSGQGGQHAKTHETDEERRRREREQTRQMAAAVDHNDALVRAGLDEFSVGRGRPQSGSRISGNTGIGQQHDKYKALKAQHYEDHGPFDAGGTLISIREDGVHAVDLRKGQKDRQRGLR